MSQRRFHRRRIAFDDNKTFLNFIKTYKFLFSNGGAHTNRIINIDPDVIRDVMSYNDYYILYLICDKGTWDYIKAYNKFDRVTIWQRGLSGGYATSYTHYAGKLEGGV